MTFSGRVEEISHMRGLLVSFEGRSPNLGDTIRVKGGKILGRVDTVLGPVDSGLVHVYPISRGVEVERAMGSPVEIAPRKSGRSRSGERPRGRGSGHRSEKGRSRDSGRREQSGKRDRSGRREQSGRRGQSNGRRRGDTPNRGTGPHRGRSQKFDNRGSRKNSRGRGRR